MTMDQRIDVHDTAFMTSAFRASNEDLSMDPYAKLWLNGNAERWSQDYLTRVSAEEASAHCLRNRFFLDKITELHARGEIEVLINFGSGFSMYPYLLPSSMRHIEIDKAEVIEYKRSKTEEGQSRGALPRRDIHYVSVDFTTGYQDTLRSKILESCAGKKSFILLEGVLFFLLREESDRLFEFFASIQERDGYVGSASFRPDLTGTTAWQRLMTFVKATTHAKEDTFCLTVEDSYYRSRNGYDLIEAEDFFSLSARYGHRPELEADLILNECFYLLKRK